MVVKSVTVSINNQWACSQIFYEDGSVLKNGDDRIAERADYYGCSPKTLQSYVTSGNVLGIEAFGSRNVYHCGPDEIKGPVPAADKKIMLKPGTRGISYAICEWSPVSAEIVMATNLTTKEGKLRKQPTATLRSMVSGTVVCVTCHC